MKTTLLLLAAMALPVCGQVMRYDLSRVPAHLRSNEPQMLDGMVMGYRGTNVLVGVKGFIETRGQGTTTFFRGGNGKMQARTMPGQVVTHVVTNMFLLKAYPKWREMRPGDRVSVLTIHGPSVQGTRDAYFVPKPTRGKTHTG